jgi:hypothetical protein
LREWPAILAKARAVAWSPWIKIDPHFVFNSSFCQYQNQRSGAPRGPFSFPADEPFLNGCFVLNHDDPNLTAPRFYNMTSDLLNWLADPAHQGFFSDLPEQLPLTIALCFKLSASACSNSSTSLAWRATVQQLYDSANLLLQKVPWLQSNQLQFILDGAAAPTDLNQCLYQLWRPWNATYSFTPTSNTPFDAAFSNNITLGYDRFQVLNQPSFSDDSIGYDPQLAALYLEFFQVFDYAKFAAEPTTYPMLLWEPSDQATIAAIIAAYRHPAAPRPPPGGLRFAINIDPAQFQVYSNANGFSVPLVPSSPPFPSTRVFTLPTSAGWLTLSNAPESLQVQGLLYSFATNTTQPINSTVTLGSPLAAALVLDESAGLYLLSEVAGSFWVVAFAPSSWQLSAVFTLALPPVALTATTLLPTPDVGTWYVSQAVFNAGLLTWRSYVLTQLPHWSADFLTSQAIPVNTTASLNSLSVSMAAAPASNGWQGLLAMGTATGNTMLCAVTASETMSFQFRWLPVPAVGTRPAVTVTPDGCSGELMALLVTGDGFCFNAETYNKETPVAVCDHPPVSTPGVLNYYFAPLSAWFSNDLSLNACNPQILAGAYDQGFFPSVGLYPTTQSPSAWSPCLGVLATHQTFANLTDTSFPNTICGPTANQNNIVMVSWALARPQQP